jgi:cysteine desulfurase/selenocysteine lyase
MTISPASTTAATAAPPEDFPVLSRRIDGDAITYLDNAATTLKPRSVIDAVAGYYAQTGANIHRGKHYLSEEASVLYERTRTTVADYLGAASNEIVLTHNTTHGLNMVAHGLAISSNDVVVMPLDSHHSAMLPWRRHAQVQWIRPCPDGALDLNHYHDLLRLRPKVVCLTHCSNVTGHYLPLAPMVMAAKEVGATVVVDAAQSIPHRRLDLATLPADFVAFSGHKMLGPTGTGVLFGRHEALAGLEPLQLGGGTVDWVDLDGFMMRKIPHRFEAGTPNIAGVIGLHVAIEYLSTLGASRLIEHDLRLGRRLIAEARQRPYIEIMADTDEFERAALLSIGIHGVQNLSDIARILSDSYGIMCRSGHLCAQPLVDSLTDSEVLRISAYVYNNEDDVCRVFDALDEIHEVLTGRAGS